MKLTLTKENIIELAIKLMEESQTTLSSPGICLACGEEANGVEPDARERECVVCHMPKVYGAEEVLIMLA